MPLEPRPQASSRSLRAEASTEHWHAKWQSVMEEMGFEKLNSDECVISKRQGLDALVCG